MDGARTNDVHTRRILADWLKEALNLSGEVQLSPFSYPQGGTGNSADTSFADLRYEVDGRRCLRSLAFRRQRLGDELFYQSEIDLPFNVMAALGAEGSVPAPKAFALEATGEVIGEPFFVVEKVEGRVVNQIPNPNQSGWLADLPPERRRAVWRNAIEVMAKLHNIDWRNGFEFLNKSDYGPPGLDQYLAYCGDWYDWARAGRDIPIMDAALEHLRANKPTDADVSVLWGDPAPYNILFDAQLSVRTIVDFEMAALGPGEVDLAWWLNSEEHRTTLVGVPLLEGLPEAQETLEIYADLRGRAPKDMPYYRLLAHFRGAACLLRLGDRLVAKGHMPDGTDFATHNSGVRALAEMLGLEPPSLGAGQDLFMQGVGRRIQQRDLQRAAV